MKYIILTETINTQSEGLIFRLLQKLLPAANPDFEKLYQSVVKWYLEIDETGKPIREIGIDAKESTIVIGPWRRNRGLWTDSPVLSEAKNYTSLPKTDFENKWNKYIENEEV